jgi:putative hemolysin
MEPEPTLAILVIVAGSVLLGLTAAAETALERASDVRIQALAARGDRRAQLIAGTLDQPNRFLAPLTVARVTFAAVVVLAFAYLGARAYSPFAGVAGFGAIGGLVAAIVQLTVGLIAARHPEYAALRLSRVVRMAHIGFALPAFLLSLPARVFARFLRAVPFELGRDAHDILSLVEREEAAGGVEEEERRMIRGIIALEDKTAREIMVPRIDIAAIEVEEDLSAAVKLVIDRGFSRVPVYRETIDDIVGIVYAKDLLRAFSNGNGAVELSDLLREPMFIPETKRLDQLLTEMRAARTHLAIVVDEYGGTAGLVTIEDLLEEIVGEIEDEYDVSRPAMEVVSEDEVVLDASAPTDVLAELFGYRIESEDFDTVGGFLIHELGRLPSVGDEVSTNGLKMRVLSMSGRRVRRMRVTRVREETHEGAATA